MTTLLPKFRTKYGEDIGIQLFFSFPELHQNEKAYLDADGNSGETSLSADGVNFSVGQFVVIGTPGQEKTEIIQLSTTVAPTATLFTFATPLVFSHNRGDLIRFIPANQIVAERSTDAGTNFSALTAINIRADATETYYNRPTDALTDVYRFRFFNSYSGGYSSYSDNSVATGYGDNTIWATKNRALSQLGEQRTSLITDQFLNDSIMEARRICDQNPATLRWTFRTQFGVILGQLLAGQWKITAPTDLRDRNTFKNILSLRYGAQNRALTYQDRRRFNMNYLNVVHATIASDVLLGATSVTLSSTHDLDSPRGAITIANETAGASLVVISYTGNNKATNTLTGCTGVTRNITAGVDAWQRAVLGPSSLPSAFTIDNGYIYFDVPVGTQWDGQDLKGDYYKAIPVIDSDADTYDEPFYDMYVSYLKYKIKYLKANGKIDRDSDPDYKDWIAGVGALIGQETSGQMINFCPDVEGFLNSVP